MSEAASHCPNCAHKLPLQQLQWSEPLACPKCSRTYLGEAFPALLRGLSEGAMPQRLIDSSEASCFFHPANRAAQSCTSCGRFMCELCALDLPTGTVCPECFATGGHAGAAAPATDRSRRIWGSLVMLLAFGPILVWPVSAIAAPAGIAVAIYGWNKPGSLTGKGRWKLWLGLLSCMAITLVWAWFMVVLFQAPETR